MKYLAVIVMLCCMASGCGKCEVKKEPIVAKVNNYEMTARDFKDEARLILPNKRLSGDKDKAKEELLGEIVTKKLLIQEAQKGNFDKDPAFMKEIERYWEQALLKLLYKKKVDELSRTVTVEPGDDKDEKIREALGAWVDGLKTKADIKIYKDELKKVDIE